MIDYATVPNVSGAFPSVVGLNSTGPGVNDGTPYLKSIIDDLWGFSQALMDAAGLIPSGSSEVYNSSQRLEAIRRITGYPGEVVAWMGNDADPRTPLGVRLIPLNGQGVLRAQYSDLDDVCYVGDSDNPTASAFFHADDAAGTSRNTAGIYLILPDCRGYAIRGLDLAGAVDLDGAGRDIGGWQLGGIESHEHAIVQQFYSPSTKTPYEAGLFYVNTGWDSTANLAFTRSYSGPQLGNFIAGGGSYQDPYVGDTRIANIAARWCIRY